MNWDLWIPPVLTVTTGGLSLFFIKRFVQNFDQHKKDVEEALVEVNRQVNAFTKESYAMFQRLHEFATELKMNQKLDYYNLETQLGKIHSEQIDEFHKFQKRLVLYDEVLKKLIDEWKIEKESLKKIESDFASIQVKISETLVMIKKRNQ